MQFENNMKHDNGQYFMQLISYGLTFLKTHIPGDVVFISSKSEH